MKLQSNIISPKVKGKRFRVINTAGSHNYPMGKVFTFKKDFPETSTPGASMGSDMAIEVMGGNAIAMSSCFLLDFDMPTLKGMKAHYDEELKNLQEQIDEIEKKINFCENNGLNMFDDDIYRIDKTMEVLESTKNKEDKRKLIVSLMKGEFI